MRFNKTLKLAASKFQQLLRSHVGLELTQTGATQSRAFNDSVRVGNYKIISLGSNVATDKVKIITSAYTKATVGFSKTQYFKFHSIINFLKKDGNSTKEVSVNRGAFNKK